VLLESCLLLFATFREVAMHRDLRDGQWSCADDLVAQPVPWFDCEPAAQAGLANVVGAPYSSVTGGMENVADGAGSSVSGGSYNTVSGVNSSVSGGVNNATSASFASVSGGGSNVAGPGGSPLCSLDAETGASVSGGVNYRARGGWSSISGGTGNLITGGRSSVAGGTVPNVTDANEWRAPHQDRLLLRLSPPPGAIARKS